MIETCRWTIDLINLMETGYLPGPYYDWCSLGKSLLVIYVKSLQTENQLIIKVEFIKSP